METSNFPEGMEQVFDLNQNTINLNNGGNNKKKQKKQGNEDNQVIAQTRMLSEYNVYCPETALE